MEQSNNYEYRRDNEGRLLRSSSSEAESKIGDVPIGVNKTISLIIVDKDKEELYIKAGEMTIKHLEDQLKKKKADFAFYDKLNPKLTEKDIQKLESALTALKGSKDLKKMNIQAIDNLAQNIIKHRNLAIEIENIEKILADARAEMDAYLSLKNGER
jgi:hypothetical protein